MVICRREHGEVLININDPVDFLEVFNEVFNERVKDFK